MTKKKSFKQGFRLLGLRGKLLLVTLTLFIFPLAGFSYLNELETFLKHNHSQSVLVVAKTIAAAFKDNASLINLNQITDSPEKAIYSHPLKNKIVIDGYADDWFALQDTQQSFKSSSDSKNNKLTVLTTNNDQFYYFLLTINKQHSSEKKSFGTVSSPTSESTNVIHFKYLDYAHQIRDYRFHLSTPGWVNGQLNSPLFPGLTPQIRGEWQENRQGYTLEFKVAIAQINHHIAFEVKKETNNTSQSLISTVLPGKLNTGYQLNPLILTDPLSNLRLQQLVPDDTQLWLLNNAHYINASAKKSTPSNKKTDNNHSLLSVYRRFYLVIMDYPRQNSLYGKSESQLNNAEITATLDGQSSIQWSDNPRSNKLTLSVTTPVYDNDHNVIGSLVLEQDNDSVLALQDKTFERILLLTIILFFGVALSLLFFATRLLKRIINLRNDTEQALTQDGIIKNQLYRNDNDEIGDLARSFSSLLTQVEENNQYLKSLSSKLSHELRTPLTIIKSSLENLISDSLTEENLKYSLRARQGCTRLNDLLNRMSEANRLEQSINSMEKEPIEMVSYMQNYVEAIQGINPDVQFIFDTSVEQQQLSISPELIAQLLDKLISNAISFHTIGTPIKVSLFKTKRTITIDLNNFGPLIDDNKLDSIFNSLTSYRHKQSDQVHLGLGLYIANLISKFHYGELKAKNNTSDQSVSLILTLPIETVSKDMR